jgi:hypothetical protein
VKLIPETLFSGWFDYLEMGGSYYLEKYNASEKKSSPVFPFQKVASQVF